MEIIPAWAVWLTFGVILFISEIFTASFFLFCFGVGAVLAAAAAALGFGDAVQWLSFLIVSTLVVGLSRSLGEKYAKEPERKAGVDRFMGKEAVVIERVDPQKGSGRIRVLHEEWRANPQNEESFEEDEKVVVTGVEGTHLVVAPLDGTK